MIMSDFMFQSVMAHRKINMTIQLTGGNEEGIFYSGEHLTANVSWDVLKSTKCLRELFSVIFTYCYKLQVPDY